MAETPSDPQSLASAEAELEVLLGRFREALATVVDGLAPLATETEPTPASAIASASQPAAPVPRAAELAELLAGNDTRAEEVLAEMRRAWPGAQPAWLAEASRAVDELDYPAALAKLREAGAIPPAA